MILTALQSNQNHIDSYSPFFLFFLFQFLVPCLISYLALMRTAYSKLKGLSQFQLYFLFLSLMHIFSLCLQLIDLRGRVYSLHQLPY